MNNTAKEKGDKYEEFIYDQICKRYENRENVIIYRKKKYPQRIANSSPLEVDISIEIKEYNDRPTEYDNLIIIECKDYARPVSRDVIDHLIRRKEDLKAIASLHYQINSPSYINFIRRNGLGESFMGLSHDNLYQLLWPIPSSEMILNPRMTQNPGY